MKDRIVKIGRVGVDSGQVVVSDPAYIKTGKGTQLPSYDRISKISIAGKNQLKNRKGIDVSVVSNTGIGDGVYPVYAIKGEMNGFGKRTKAIVVVFDGSSVVKKLKKVM